MRRLLSTWLCSWSGRPGRPGWPGRHSSRTCGTWWQQNISNRRPPKSRTHQDDDHIWQTMMCAGCTTPGAAAGVEGLAGLAGLAGTAAGDAPHAGHSRQVLAARHAACMLALLAHLDAGALAGMIMSHADQRWHRQHQQRHAIVRQTQELSEESKGTHCMGVQARQLRH